MSEDYERNPEFYDLCKEFILPNQVVLPALYYSYKNSKYELILAAQIWGLWRDKIGFSSWYTSYSKLQIWHMLRNHLLDSQMYTLDCHEGLRYTATTSIRKYKNNSDDEESSSDEEQDDSNLPIKFKIKPYAEYASNFIKLFGKKKLNETQFLQKLFELNYVIYRDYFVLSPDELLNVYAEKYPKIIEMVNCNSGSNKERDIIFAYYKIPRLQYFGVDCFGKLPMEKFIPADQLTLSVSTQLLIESNTLPIVEITECSI